MTSPADITDIEHWLTNHHLATGARWVRRAPSEFEPRETLWSVDGNRPPWAFEVCYWAGQDFASLRLVSGNANTPGYRFDVPGRIIWSNIFSAVAGLSGQGTTKFCEACELAGTLPFLEWGERTRWGVQRRVPLVELVEGLFEPVLDELVRAATRVEASFEPWAEGELSEADQRVLMGGR